MNKYTQGYWTRQFTSLKNKFIERRITDEFKLNQSGMIFHSSEVNSLKSLLSTNLNSYWFDMMLITTPGVDIIYENQLPYRRSEHTPTTFYQHPKF